MNLRLPFRLVPAITILAAFALLLIIPGTANARPEYATKEKLNCTSCHVSAWGGGPRTILGKSYGAHGNPLGKFSNQDLFYGDVRFIYFLPTHEPSKSQNGLALMEAAASANVPVLQSEESGRELRFVGTYNMAPLSGQGVREAYARWQLTPKDATTPMYVSFGRFYAPFGLLTDEHRTYTRIQTNMTYNNYDAGTAFTADAPGGIHADLALVNDFQSGGKFTSNDIRYGAVLNVRWNPESLPFLLGASGNYEHTITQPQPYASSFYAVLSLDRLSDGKISGSISGERVDAAHWNQPTLNVGDVNPGLSSFFIPTSDPAYLAQVSDTASRGYYALAKYNLTHQWTLFYKFDALALDAGASEDTFYRHGFGIEAYPVSNVIINARYEKAAGGRPEIKDSGVLATQDDIFLMLRLWI